MRFHSNFMMFSTSYSTDLDFSDSQSYYRLYALSNTNITENSILPLN